MMNEYDEEKVLFSGKVECPHCGKFLNIDLVRETIEPATKGRYKRKLLVEVDNQTRLLCNGD